MGIWGRFLFVPRSGNTHRFVSFQLYQSIVFLYWFCFLFSFFFLLIFGGALGLGHEIEAKEEETITVVFAHFESDVT